MTSIIIPAYNEETVIKRCLNAMLKGSSISEIEIIVSCNGCTDNTAQIAKSYGAPVKVIEIDKPSKTAALNEADKVASYFPRIYVDADVILPIESIREIISTVDEQKLLLASPRAITFLNDSSQTVKGFYKIWSMLPYNKVMVGTGVYVLSEKGRTRFSIFPEVISDDGFVRTRFKPEERVVIENATVTVFAPKTYDDLLKVKIRSRIGWYELNHLYPNAEGIDKKNFFEIAKAVPFSIFLPWQILLYFWINILVRSKAKKIFLLNKKYKWERDDSTRRL